MKRKKLNIGVIGIGYLGKYHLQKFITNRNCKTTWIVDLDPNNLSQNISDSIKKTTKYKDIDGLITKVHSIEHKLYPMIIKMIVEGEINLNELNGKNFKCYEDEFDL